MVEHRIDMYRFDWELSKIKEKPVKDNCILFYGSSTFAFWKDIENLFQNSINAGFGGSTADEALFHYENVAKRFNPKVVVWYFGDNEPVCGYSVEETKELFMSTWEKFLNDNPNVKIITIATKTSPARNEYAPFVRELNKWQKEMADKYDWLTYIETKDLCYDADGDYKLYSYIEDQLHFSKISYDIIKERLDKELNK